MSFFDRLLPEPEFISLARKSGKSSAWYIEILLFIAVFSVASTLASILITPAILIWLFTGDTLQKLGEIFTSGIMGGGVISAFMSEMPWWLMLVQLFATVFTTAAAMLFCRFIQKRGFSTMGFIKNGAVKEALFGLLLGAVMISAPLLLCVLTGDAKITGISVDFNIGILLLFFIGYLLQGFSEEVLCRGYFMTSFARRYPLWVAVLVNSVIFGLLHLGNGGISPLALLNLVLFGIFASVYTIKRGNIWGIAAIHAAWNFVQGNIYGIKVSGTTMGCSLFGCEFDNTRSILNGGAFGLEGGLGVTAVLLIATAIVLLTKSKNQAIKTEIEE